MSVSGTGSVAEAPVVLAGGEIHLWLVDYESITDAGLLESYLTLLNPAERAQQVRFYFARDRVRYLVTRALVRTVLSRYVAAVAPAAWTFANNAYGRPEISNAGVRCSGLTFNLSHTHSLIVLGITQHRALGVDVENITSRDAALAVANRFFSPDEVAALNSLPVDQQPYRFWEYWTLKEAYIKARGMGLSLPLGKFSCHYPTPTTASLSIDPSLEDDASRWQLWQFRPSGDYLISICAERLAAAPASELLVRSAVPGVSGTVLQPTLLRTSAC